MGADGVAVPLESAGGGEAAVGGGAEELPLIAGGGEGVGAAADCSAFEGSAAAASEARPGVILEGGGDLANGLGVVSLRREEIESRYSKSSQSGNWASTRAAVPCA